MVVPLKFFGGELFGLVCGSELSEFCGGLALKPGVVELRSYQVSAAKSILAEGNSLLVMPTALGKTFVALLVVAAFLKRSSKRVLFLAPTKPLVVQQAKRLAGALDVGESEVVVVSGEVGPAERARLYAGARVVCGTPQAVENDLLSRRLDLKDFSLVVFDEAHRAVGDYSYVFIARVAREAGAFVLGLTASPSAEREKFGEVVENLGVRHVEVKSEEDEDVRGYAKPVALAWEFVEVPREFLLVRGLLEEMLAETMRALKELGVVESADVRLASKRFLLQLRSRLVGAAEKTPGVFRAISLQAKAMNLEHAIELLESQGVSSLLGFLKGMRERKAKSKAVRELLSDFRLRKAEIACEGLLAGGVEHPKLARLKELVGAAVAGGESVIVFAHYRSTTDKIVGELNGVAGVKAERLVGRAREGMSQREQAGLLERFRGGEFNVLVATQVGEEGLDVPGVDLVVFYEPVPSEIRFIQRRGRTGRARAGRAVVLIAKGTKDEAFFWSARRKEKALKVQLGLLRGARGQRLLREF
ncbi:MAG: helicase-related protein [Candidatus Micrarchaeia archaeon]